MIITDADGTFLYDSGGKRYLNFAESTNVLGHNNHEVLGIISDYLKKGFIHYPLTISLPEIANTIIEQLGTLSTIELGGGIFSSSGSEACDVALSIMSDFGPVITVEGGYHGNSGEFLRKKRNDTSLYEYNYEIPFPYSESVLESIDAAVARGARSILLEPLQVEGGIRGVYRNFLRDIRKNFPELVICTDESYTGLGKTGKFFSFQWFDEAPDILVLGKAIGGGLPLGLTIVNQNVKKTAPVIANFRNGAFGSSAGNILSLHLANFMISKISDKQFLSGIMKKGALLEEKSGPKLKKRLRGIGLIRGIGFENERGSTEFSKKLMNNGILATSMRDAVRLSPPLTVGTQDLMEGIRKIESLLE